MEIPTGTPSLTARLPMPTDQLQSESLVRQLAISAGILVATFACYLPATQCDYIWDDDDYVIENKTLRSAEGLKQIWFQVGATPQYYPMVHTTYWVEYQLWGLDPTGYHVVNILLHGINAILIWKLLQFLQVPGSLLAGLLFALHPVHVESVAWITERKNTLSGLFYLLSAWCFLRTILRSAEEKFSKPLYLASLLLFGAALLSKSVTATLPAALLLIVVWKRRKFNRSDILPVLPMLIAAIPMAIITAWVEKNIVGTMYVNLDLSPLDRLLVAGRACWCYAAKLLLPLKLTFIYPRWNIDPATWWQGLFPLTALGLVGTCWWQRQRFGTGTLVAVLFFGGTLVPALGFVDVYPMRFSFVADHFQYLASLGLLTLGAATLTNGLQRLGSEAQYHQRVIVTSALLLILLGVLTWRNCAKYENLDTLWTDTVQKNPTSQIAHNSLGALRSDQGRIREALPLLERSIQIDPEYAEAYNNLAIVYGQLGLLEKAYQSVQKAIELQPGYAKAHFNLAIWFYRQGQLEESQATLLQAIEFDPEFLQAYNRLGLIFLEQGKRSEAILNFRQALKLNPNNEQARINLSRAMLLP